PSPASGRGLSLDPPASRPYLPAREATSSPSLGAKSGTARPFAKGGPHGLDSVAGRRVVRSRLGLFHEAVARLHPAVADGADLRDDVHQLRHALGGDEVAAAGDVVHGVD